MKKVIKILLGLAILATFTLATLSCDTSYKTVTSPNGHYAISYPKDWECSVEGDWLEFDGTINNDSVKFSSSITGDGYSYNNQVQTLLIQLEGVEMVVRDERYGDILLSILCRETTYNEDYTQLIIVCQVEEKITVVNSLLYPQSGDIDAIHDMALKMIKSIKIIP